MSSGLRQFAPVVREQRFRRLLLTRVCGQLADGAFQAGLASFALFSPEQAPSAGAIAAGFALLLLPFTLVGPLTGMFLDRWSRRRVLVIANIVRAAAVATLAVLLATAHVGPPFVALALVALSANRFVAAAVGASLPHVVPLSALVPANGLAPTLGSISYICGLAIGSVLSGPPAMGLATGLYAVAAATATRLPWLGPDAEEASSSSRRALRHVVTSAADAVRHVNRRAGTALAVIAAVRLPYGVLLVQTVLVHRWQNDHGEVGLGGLTLVAMASGLGFGLAAWLAPTIAASAGLRRTMLLGLWASAAATLVALPLTTPWLAAAGFLIGAMTQTVKICVDSVVQREVGDVFRGRVFTIYDIGFNVGLVASTWVASLVLPPDGHSAWVVLGAAAAYLVIGLSLATMWPPRLAGDAAPTPRPHQPLPH